MSRNRQTSVRLRDGVVRSVGRPQARLSDKLLKMASKRWMPEHEDRTNGRAFWEAYVRDDGTKYDLLNFTII